MKFIANLARILVGVEFVFSGFVKVVDPYGTGLKFQEYFEVFAKDIPALSGFFEIIASQSQLLSLIFCAAELILGVALLVKFQMPKTAWIVLLLMSFFTFLTFYSAFFERVTDCGCFGDFLKLKPWHSFYKDVISIAVILVIFLNRKNYGSFKFAMPVTALATIIAFGIGIYGKMYLPILDFLPYAKGLSITEQMKPTGVTPIFEYTFLDKTKNEEIKSKEYLADTNTYKYVSLITLNEDLLRPKITDYSIGDTSGNDVTSFSLEGNKLLIGLKKTKGIDKNTIVGLSKLIEESKNSGVELMLISSLQTSEVVDFITKNNLQIGYYTIDEKVLKTMARTNPCVILLANGIVQEKWSHKSIPSFETVKSLIK